VNLKINHEEHKGHEEKIIREWTQRARRKNNQRMNAKVQSWITQCLAWFLKSLILCVYLGCI